MESLRIEHGSRSYEISRPLGAAAVKLYKELVRHPKDEKALH